MKQIFAAGLVTLSETNATGPSTMYNKVASFIYGPINPNVFFSSVLSAPFEGEKLPGQRMVTGDF